MKKIENYKSANLNGGVTGRGCLIAGTSTLIYLVFGQWGWALGTYAGAAVSGCFDY